MDAQQRLPREGSAEAVTQQPVKRADTQRSDTQVLHALIRKCSLKLRRLDVARQSPGEQHANTAIAEPSQRKREGARRRRIQPRNVIDGQEQRPLVAEELQHVADSHDKGTLVDGLVRSVLAQKCDLESSTSWRQQFGQDVIEDVIEEIAKPDVGETAFGLRRPCREHRQATLAGACDSREPERRFPNPSLALKHERRRPVDSTVEEAIDRAELRLAPDDLNSVHATILTVPKADVSTALTGPVVTSQP
jgi:hypothetical protein